MLGAVPFEAVAGTNLKFSGIGGCRGAKHFRDVKHCGIYDATLILF